MKDYIVRATAGDGQIRAFAATTGNLVEEARKRHDTSPVATAALGRLLTAGAMMAMAGAPVQAAEGEKVIKEQLSVISNEKVKEKTIEYLQKIKEGQRDFRF